MKNIFLVSLLLCTHSFVLGQNAKNVDSVKTKIYIVGVVHSENEFRNSDSLLNILKDIKPDLILSEFDSTQTFFHKGYVISKIPWWYTVARQLRIFRKVPPEIEVLYKYKKIDGSVKILPFDKEISNRRKFAKHYNQSKENWSLALENAFTRGLMPDSLSEVRSNLVKYDDWLYHTAQKGYREINKPVVSDSIRQKQMIESEYFFRLIDSVETFKEFKSWKAVYNSMYLDRNEVMVNNIIKLTEIIKAKKVVVFPGLMHKYYLTNFLNVYNSKQKYEIIEYFEK